MEVLIYALGVYLLLFEIFFATQMSCSKGNKFGCRIGWMVRQRHAVTCTEMNAIRILIHTIAVPFGFLAGID